MVERLATWTGPAHTLVSFGFKDGSYIAISVEIRKEVGEVYSPIKGMLREFELMYVIGDESDLIRLRTNFRKDTVYLYPIKASKDQMKRMFVSMLKRTKKLSEEPEFYNTITNSCTTNIVDHINELVPGRIPFSYKVLLPGYSDKLAYDLGLIDTELAFEDVREKFKITKQALKYKEPGNFSKFIREPF